MPINQEVIRLSKEMFEYYTSIHASITGEEMKTISSDRYDIIERLAYEDVANDRKARPEKEFKSNAEYKSYLLNLVDFAYKRKDGIVPELGSE